MTRRNSRTKMHSGLEMTVGATYAVPKLPYTRAFTETPAPRRDQHPTAGGRVQYIKRIYAFGRDKCMRARNCFVLSHTVSQLTGVRSVPHIVATEKYRFPFRKFSQLLHLPFYTMLCRIRNIRATRYLLVASLLAGEQPWLLGSADTNTRDPRQKVPHFGKIKTLTS